MATNKKSNYECFVKHLSDMDHRWLLWTIGLEHLVELPHDIKNHAQIKRWCDETLDDKIAFLDDYGNGYLVYFFLESDMVSFKLKWLPF